MAAYRYVGHPDDDNAPVPVVDGKPLPIGALVRGDEYRNDQRFTRVVDPDEKPAEAKPKAKAHK